jgi:hypothetical protein
MVLPTQYDQSDQGNEQNADHNSCSWPLKFGHSQKLEKSIFFNTDMQISKGAHPQGSLESNKFEKPELHYQNM